MVYKGQQASQSQSPIVNALSRPRRRPLRACRNRSSCGSECDDARRPPSCGQRPRSPRLAVPWRIPARIFTSSTRLALSSSPSRRTSPPTAPHRRLILFGPAGSRTRPGSTPGRVPSASSSRRGTFRRRLRSQAHQTLFYFNSITPHLQGRHLAAGSSGRRGSWCALSKC